MRGSSALSLSAIVVLTLASCTATEPAASNEVAAVEEQPPPKPDDRPLVDLGPLIGKRRLSTPTAGRSAMAIHAEQDRFISTEWKVDESLDGGASLELREDGSAYACFWGKTRSGSSRSKYISDDGQHHSTAITTMFRFGLRGTWVAEPAAARVTVQFTTKQYETCEPSAEAHPLPTVSSMSCHAIEAGDGLPVAALICRPPAVERDIHRVSMALEPSPRSGPWATRDDPTLRHGRAFGDEVQPWLLLGTPGLLILATDDREREPVSVSLMAADVPTPTGTLERPAEP
jgi:hypothetical protein